MGRTRRVRHVLGIEVGRCVRRGTRLHMRAAILEYAVTRASRVPSRLGRCTSTLYRWIEERDPREPLTDRRSGEIQAI